MEAGGGLLRSKGLVRWEVGKQARATWIYREKSIIGNCPMIFGTYVGTSRHMTKFQEI